MVVLFNALVCELVMIQIYKKRCKEKCARNKVQGTRYNVQGARYKVQGDRYKVLHTASVVAIV